MREQNRHRHELVGLIRGIPEHHALVAGAAGVDTHRDIRRLPIDRTDHRARLAVESERGVGISDACDRGTNDVRYGHIRRRRDLAGDAGETGRHQRFTGNPGFRIVSENGVEDGIGDGIGDLVGMALGDGFRREEMAIVHGIGIRVKDCRSISTLDGRRSTL
jgi:hypothetical protein